MKPISPPVVSIGDVDTIPPRFREALMSMRDTARPRGLVLEEVSAPRRLAPYAAALSAETVEMIGEVPVSSGRLVVLHDPQGQDAWNGDFRLVVMVRAHVEEEIGTDPPLGRAAWSWLTDCLEEAGAGYHSLVGTVTRVLSQTFGGLELTDSTANAEIRASWSPTTPDLGPHLEAWYALLHIAAGHEPESAVTLTLSGSEQ